MGGEVDRRLEEAGIILPEVMPAGTSHHDDLGSWRS